MAGSNSRNKGRKGGKGHAAHRVSNFHNAFPHQKNEPSFARESTVTSKILDYILESPGGKRTLSRLARTCKALQEPALNTLWRNLDSLVPLLWQFPGHLLKRARKPGMGFMKSPTQEDWEQVLKYAGRVRQVTYNESAGNVAASIFSVLEENRPTPHILPCLTELTWKVETSSYLDHCSMFLHSELRVLNLEIGGKAPRLNMFLSDVSSHTTLSSFSFVSPAALPITFTHLLKRQQALEQITLVAPGALGAGVGRWASSLPQLKSLRIDLTGRSPSTVEGFFDELRIHSGASTPDSRGSVDSGVFSEEDFSVIRTKTNEAFPNLHKLHLSGEATNIRTFVKNLDSPLNQLELTLEDPIDRADWNDLCRLICDKFGSSLQSLKVSTASGPRPGLVESVRQTARGEKLSLQQLRHLPRLVRLEIDLSEFLVFHEADLECIARASPNLRILKLCPTARASTAPKITLESLANLLIRCRRLHTIAAVVDARPGNPDILRSRQTSSKSLLRLHVGHSWVEDPLQVAIILSHMAPRLETLKFFQENNRPGFNEAHARTWQQVAELLPHLQGIRLLEQQLAPPPMLYAEPEQAERFDKAVDAAVRTVDQGIHVAPEMSSAGLQVSPVLFDQEVEAKPAFRSISINAAPQFIETAVEATPIFIDCEIDATPPPVPEAKPDSKPSITRSMQTFITPYTFKRRSQYLHVPHLLLLSSLIGLLSFTYRLLVLYPISLPSRIIRTASAQVYWRSEPIKPANQLKSYDGYVPSPEVMEIQLDTLPDTGH